MKNALRSSGKKKSAQNDESLWFTTSVSASNHDQSIVLVSYIVITACMFKKQPTISVRFEYQWQLFEVCSSHFMVSFFRGQCGITTISWQETHVRDQY